MVQQPAAPGTDDALRRRARCRPRNGCGNCGTIYADDVPARDILRHTSSDQLASFGSMEIMPSVPHWHRGRMVLVGDAAHAPSSSSGQGASLAAESAVQLARCLRDLPDVPQRIRRLRAAAPAPGGEGRRRAAKTNNGKAPGRRRSP